MCVESYDVIFVANVSFNAALLQASFLTINSNGHDWQYNQHIQYSFVASIG